IQDSIVDIACKARGGIGTRRVAHELHPGAAAFRRPHERSFPWALARRWAPYRFPLSDRFGLSGPRLNRSVTSRDWGAGLFPRHPVKIQGWRASAAGGGSAMDGALPEQTAFPPFCL